MTATTSLTTTTPSRSTDGPSIIRLVRADLLKATTGRAWWGLLLGGLAFGWLTSYGYVVDGADRLLDVETITASVARAWMTIFLFAGLLSGVVYARDAGCGALARSIWVAGDRRRAFQVRLVSALTIGATFTLVGTACAVLSPIVLMPVRDLDASWSTEVVLTIVGVGFSTMSATLAGLFVGMIARSVAVAATVVTVVTLLVDPLLQRLVPQPAGFLYTIALSAVYRDDKPDLLTMPVGMVVSSMWVLALAVFAWRSHNRRDVV